MMLFMLSGTFFDRKLINYKNIKFAGTKKMEDRPTVLLSQDAPNATRAAFLTSVFSTYLDYVFSNSPNVVYIVN